MNILLKQPKYIRYGDILYVSTNPGPQLENIPWWSGNILRG